MKSLRKKVGEENRTQLQAVSFSSADSTIESLKKNNIDSYDELESYKRLRKRRTKIAVLRLVTWMLVLIIIPFIVFFSIIIINPNTGNNFFGYVLYIVKTESMEPEINVNDCIVVKRVDSLSAIKEGVDITFVRASDGQTVTHRVIQVCHDDEVNRTYYVTKGINNPSADTSVVYFEDVVGVRVLTIGWLGQIIMFFRTAYGIITFIAILLIIFAGFYFSFKVSDDIRAVGK